MADVVEMASWRADHLGELCPGCAYRVAGPRGLCGECLGEREPSAVVLDLEHRRELTRQRMRRLRERRRAALTAVA